MAFVDVATMFSSSHQKCFIKKAFLNIFAIFTQKHLCWSHLREILTHEFSCEYCETFTNSYFEEHPQTAAFLFFLSMRTNILNAHGLCGQCFIIHIYC